MLRFCLLYYHHHDIIFLFLCRSTLTTAFVPTPPPPLPPTSSRSSPPPHARAASCAAHIKSSQCASMYVCVRVCGDAVTCGLVTNAHDHNATQKPHIPEGRQEGAVRRTLSTLGTLGTLTPSPSSHPGGRPLSLPLLHLLHPLFRFFFLPSLSSLSMHFFFLSLSFKKSKSVKVLILQRSSHVTARSFQMPPLVLDLEPAASISCVEGESFREAGEESRGSNTFSLTNSRVRIFSVDFKKAKLV